MNPFKALEQLLNLLPKNAEDILTKSHDLESKISVLPNEVDELAQKAETFIDGFLEEMAKLIDVSAIEKLLAENADYEKLKGQNISGLFTLPEGFKPEDFSQYGGLASQKLDWLQTFLQPLNIANETEIFTLLKEIITDILALPEDFDAGDQGMLAAYQQIKSDQLEEKIPKLLELLFGITPPSDPIPSTDEALISEIEAQAPNIKAQIEQLEGEQMDFANVESTITNLIPVIDKILAQMPAGSPTVNLSGVEPFLQELQQQLKLLNTSQTDLLVETSLEIAANLSAKYIPSDSPFDFITEILQKAYHIVHFLVSNGLILPIQFHILSANESLPATNGINPPPPVTPTMSRASTPAPAPAKLSTDHHGTPAAPVNNGTPERNAHPTSANSGTLQPNTTVTGNQGFAQKLLFDGLALLEAHEKQLAEDWLSGAVFGPMTQAAEDFADQLIGNFTNAGQTTWQDAQKATATLETLVQQVVDQVNAFVAAIVNGAELLLKQVLNTITSSVKMVVNWLLAIKIPTTFLTNWVPDMASISQVNLLCLLLATPWDVIEKLKNLTVSEVEGWATGQNA